ncbi:hypothetical protein MRX96_014999 [Rhipicephalus microplus]
MKERLKQESSNVEDGQTVLSIHGASMSVTSPVLDVPAEATAQAATPVSTETSQVALASCTAPEDVVMEIDGLFTPLKALPLQRPPSTIVNASIAYIAGDEHGASTLSVVFDKFIKPLLSNVGAAVTDRAAYRKKLACKPLYRKVLRV